MYYLHVFYAGEMRPREVYRAARASEILRKIRAILAEHPGCERIAVFAGMTRLFAVDATGERLPE